MEKNNRSQRDASGEHHAASIITKGRVNDLQKLIGKRVLAVLIAVMMVVCLLPGTALAEGETEERKIPFTATANGEQLTVGVAAEAYEYFDYMTETTVKTDLYTVAVPLVYIEKITLDFGEEAVGLYAYDSSGNYVAGLGSPQGETGADVQDFDSYIYVQTPYSEDYSSGGEMKYVVCFKPAFEARAAETGNPLTNITAKKDGYLFKDTYNEIDYYGYLYTIVVPYGVEEIEFTFSDNCLAYNYSATGEDPYVSDEYYGPWYDDVTVGSSECKRKIDENGDGVIDFIQVQNLYTLPDWKGAELRYAITFVYDIFGAYVNGEAMTDITAEEGAYPNYTFDPVTWEPIPGDPVTLYTIALPDNTASVDLSFPEGVLPYNYKSDGLTYIDGEFNDDELFTGITEATVSVDADEDGECDYIVVQSPYDENYSNSVLYAITFTCAGNGSQEPAELTLDQLRDNIAAKYAEAGIASDPQAFWLTADMAAYEAAFPESESRLSAGQKQEMVDSAIAVIAAASSSSDAAKGIIALAAMGCDPRQLTTAKGEKLDAVARLDELTFGEDGKLIDGGDYFYYSLPYILIAYQQFDDCQTQTDALKAEALAEKESWLDTAWGTDGLTPMMLALAPYYSEADVKEALDTAAAAVEEAQQEDGSLGNAASTGLAMAGLAAMGIDPAGVKTAEDGRSLADGMLAFAGSDGASLGNSFDTEQGFRGLVALANVGGRLYDFSGNISNREPAAATPEAAFTDVPADAYYAAAVNWAVENGITTGTGETTFSPDNSCTRAQTVTFLWRAAGSPTPGVTETAFTDLDSEAYYYQAVLWAIKNGITTGKTETAFGPDDTVNRAQAATFIYRFANSPAVEKTDVFTDVVADSYYADAVSWAYAEGITTGTTETTFSPDNSCIRAQIVTFLYRYFEGK